MPADPRYPTVVFPPEYSGSDNEWENEDRPKRTWDLPTDKAGFLAFLKASRTSVAEFKRFPIYRSHGIRSTCLRDLQEDDA